MEYEKIANLIDDASNQPSKFRTKNSVELNDESRGTYNVNSQIKFKTTKLKSSLCDYSDACILVKGTIAVNNTAAAIADANNAMILSKCAICGRKKSRFNKKQEEKGILTSLGFKTGVDKIPFIGDCLL